MYHLGDGDSTATDFYKDSTSNGYHGTLTDTDGDTTSSVGRLGDAVDFAGDADYILTNIPWNTSQSDITLSYWNNVATAEIQESIVYFAGSPETGGERLLAHTPWSDSNIYWDYGTCCVDGRVSGDYSSFVDKWTYNSLVYRTSPSVLRGIYLDGNLEYSNTTADEPSADFATSTIGGRPGGVAPHQGDIDELRVASTSRSAAWIKAEYFNQSTTTDSYTATAEVIEWNATDWTLYDTIVIESDNIDDDLTDFPVYINLADLSPSFWATTPTGSTTVGTDIRVTTNDGSPVELPRELVAASSTAQTGELHFKANSISSTTDTTFRIYYNGSTAGDYATDATYGAENVWTNDFVAVWHMSNDPTGGAGAIIDSTANDHNGTSTGSMTSSDLVSGAVGSALRFDGTDDGIETDALFPDITGLNISAWINPVGWGEGDFGRIVDAADGGSGFILFTNDFTAPTESLRYTQITTSADGRWNSAASSIVLSEYQHINMSVADVTSNTSDPVFTINNVSSATTETTAPTGSFLQVDSILYIGNRAAGDRAYDGDIDELRISSTTRSTAWVSAEYLNQSTTTDFYTRVQAGSLTLSDSDGGQVSNTFSALNKTETEGFAFKLEPVIEAADVTNITLTVSGIHSSVSGDSVQNIKLYRDTDGDSNYDSGSDVLIDGTGVFSFDGQIGSILFDADFTATTATNYLVIFDTNDIDKNEALVIGLLPDGVEATGELSGAPLPVSGSVQSVQHSRAAVRKSGGGGSSSIGGDAPEGRSEETGGSGDGGGEVGEVDEGEDIIEDNAFYAPSETGASFNNFTNPTNAYASDGTDATVASTQKQSYGNFGFSIPGGNEIVGIAVKVDVSATDGSGSSIDITLSHDGGTSETSAQSTGALTTSDVVYTVGGPADLWGRSWSVAEFGNGNFELIVEANPGDVGQVDLDALEVRVYHQATGGGSGGGGSI